MNNPIDCYDFDNNFNFIDFAVPIINRICPMYSNNIIYNHKYFLTCIVHFIKTHVSWTQYKGTHDYPIEGKYLNSIHLKYIRAGVYKEINKELLRLYISHNREIKLKNQSIDSTFIANKEGIHNLRDKGKTKKKSSKKTKKQLSEETERKLAKITKKQLSKETKKKLAKETEKQLAKKTKKQLSKETKKQTSKKTTTQTSNKTNKQTSKKTKKQISNKTKKQTSKKTKRQQKYINNINKQAIQFNRYNGRKKYFKASFINDSMGMPLGPGGASEIVYRLRR